MAVELSPENQVFILSAVLSGAAIPLACVARTLRETQVHSKARRQLPWRKTDYLGFADMVAFAAVVAFVVDHISKSAVRSETGINTDAFSTVMILAACIALYVGFARLLNFLDATGTNIEIEMSSQSSDEQSAHAARRFFALVAFAVAAGFWVSGWIWIQNVSSDVSTIRGKT